MDYEKLMQFKNSAASFAQLIGIVITGAGDGWCEGEIEIGPQHMNPGGTVHGGCVFALLDSVGGVAAMTQGNDVTTATASTSFLNAAGPESKKLIARGKAVKNGRTLMVYDVDVHTETGRHIAHGTFTFFRFEREAQYEVKQS